VESVSSAVFRLKQIPKFGLVLVLDEAWLEQDKKRAKIANLGEVNQTLLLSFKSW